MIASSDRIKVAAAFEKFFFVCFFLVPEGFGALAEVKGVLCLHQSEDFVYSPHPLVVGDDAWHTERGRHTHQHMKT